MFSYCKWLRSILGAMMLSEVNKVFKDSPNSSLLFYILLPLPIYFDPPV